jgi:hypothetical protein
MRAGNFVRQIEGYTAFIPLFETTALDANHQNPTTGPT